jgi:hypothetical protein
MPDALRLQISLDDDGTAELFARVEANGFSGYGSAWVHAEELSELGFKLAQAFPLRETLGISGGYWSQSEPSTLEQEHLALAFYPVAGRGVIACQVRLASPLLPEDRPAGRHSVRAELLTSYQELQQFAGALAELAAGKTREAVLHAVEV